MNYGVCDINMTGASTFFYIIRTKAILYTYYCYVCIALQDKYKGFHARLPVVVAETLLAADPHIELPLWLVQMFKVNFLFT